MMEGADLVTWAGDARARFIERAVEFEVWGKSEGHYYLGKRLIQEVDEKISEIKANLNLYAPRSDDERVAALFSSNHILVYKKLCSDLGVELVILDIRRFY